MVVTRNGWHLRSVWSSWGSHSLSSTVGRVSVRPRSEGTTDLNIKLADRISLEVFPLRAGQLIIETVRPFDVDEVMDYYIVDQKQEQGDPYWAVLWASAVAVSEMILEDPKLVQGKRVATVGCGLGLDGIVAALAGADEVDLFDREPRALQCALLTAAASGLSPLTTAASFSVSLEEQESLLQLQQQLRAVSPLAKLLPSMLAPSKEIYGRNRLILTDPPERTPQHRADFLAQLAARYPDMVVDLTTTTNVDKHGVSGSVLMISLRKKVPGGGDTIGASPTSIRC